MVMRIALQGDERLAAALAKAPADVTRELGWALDRAALEVAREERRRAPKATSQLTNSIGVSRTGKLSREVGPSASYATFVERGTDGPYAGVPPQQDILDWVKTAGIQPRDPADTQDDVAWAIARAIRAQGTPAQPFVGPSVRALTPRVQLLLRQGFDRGMTAAGLPLRGR